MTPAILFLLFADIKAPPEVRTPCNRLARVEVVSTGKNTILIPPAGDCDAFQEVAANGKLSFRVICYTPGKYRLTFVTASGDVPEYATTDIIAGDLPAPVPPVPPVPTPDDITKDPLYQALASIVGGLQESDQQNSLKTLAELYRQGEVMAGQHATLGAWTGALRLLSQQAGIGNKLMTVRQRIADELSSALGTDPAANLAGGLGARCAAQCRRISLILNTLAR
jgi:hypothetical protein